MSDEDLEIIPVLKDILTVGDLEKAVTDDIDIKDIESIESFDTLFDDQQLNQLNKNITAETLVTTKYDSEYEKPNDASIEDLIENIVGEIIPVLETQIRSLVLSSLEKHLKDNTVIPDSNAFGSYSNTKGNKRTRLHPQPPEFAIIHRSKATTQPPIRATRLRSTRRTTRRTTRKATRRTTRSHNGKNLQST